MNDTKVDTLTDLICQWLDEEDLYCSRQNLSGYSRLKTYKYKQKPDHLSLPPRQRLCVIYIGYVDGTGIVGCRDRKVIRRPRGRYPIDSNSSEFGVVTYNVRDGRYGDSLHNKCVIDHRSPFFFDELRSKLVDHRPAAP